MTADKRRLPSRGIADVLGQTFPTRTGRDFTPEDVYREHAAYVGRLAYRLLGSRGDAEDLTQDVFFELVRRFSSLEQPEELKGWLTRVTVRNAYKRLRRRRLWNLIGFSDDASATLLQTTPLQEDRMQLERVLVALEKLSPGERLAWSLRHLESFKLEEVAEACNVSLATAKRRIAEAQLQLRKELA